MNPPAGAQNSTPLRTSQGTVRDVVIFLVITFGFAWFARDLNEFSLFGFPLGFYMAAQGTLVIYLFLIWIYNRRMRQLEERFGINDE
ncbi:MAG TPA: DUF4212 domain-containing protein [Polyangiaceae bacterium]|nr:DUF4212 domain-containing protein [Polyangiaceae bacterium]